MSGRGVGMDVVLSNIRQLHGTVSLASERGQSSVVSIKLPSSLMVSKGMLVQCATEQYVLPIEGVREMVKIQRDQVRTRRSPADALDEDTEIAIVEANPGEYPDTLNAGGIRFAPAT